MYKSHDVLLFGYSAGEEIKLGDLWLVVRV